MATTAADNENITHMIVFIARDGKRIAVSRAIATKASLVLCDLLDGQESTYTTTDEKLLSEVGHGSDRVTSSDSEEGRNERGKGETVRRHDPLAALFGDTSPTTGADLVSSTAQGGDSKAKEMDEKEIHVIELPFPYFPSHILEKVVEHMNYRYRVSVFGAGDNALRVFATPVRDIPRPMVLPLMEYLDAKDREFVADWDEVTAIWMVKAATLLNYELLLQLSSAKLASFLREKNIDNIRTLLGVESSDFSVAEETELRKEQYSDYSK